MWRGRGDGWTRRSRELELSLFGLRDVYSRGHAAIIIFCSVLPRHQVRKPPQLRRRPFSGAQTSGGFFWFFLVFSIHTTILTANAHRGVPNPAVKLFCPGESPGLQTYVLCLLLHRARMCRRTTGYVGSAVPPGIPDPRQCCRRCGFPPVYKTSSSTHLKMGVFISKTAFKGHRFTRTLFLRYIAARQKGIVNGKFFQRRTTILRF